VSWLIAHDVTEGRQAVNFSEWAAYEPSKQAKSLKDACEEAKDGEMPPRAYTWMHPDAKLTTQDVEAICRVAPQSGNP
jgi:Haem-binding domain